MPRFSRREKCVGTTKELLQGGEQFSDWLDLDAMARRSLASCFVFLRVTHCALRTATERRRRRRRATKRRQEGESIRFVTTAPLCSKNSATCRHKEHSTLTCGTTHEPTHGKTRETFLKFSFGGASQEFSERRATMRKQSFGDKFDTRVVHSRNDTN